MEWNTPTKIVIPKRDYQGKVQESDKLGNFEEEQKFVPTNPPILNTKKSNNPIPIKPAKPKNQAKVEKSLASISSTKQFDEMRTYVRKRLEKQIADLRKEAEIEMKMISDLERSWIALLDHSDLKSNNDHAQSETQSVHSEASSTPAKKPIPLIKSQPYSNLSSFPNVLLLASAPKSCLISRNLEKPASLDLPQYSKGMNLILLDPDSVLVAGGTQRLAYIFKISTKSIESLEKTVTARRFFAISLINSKPALIGGILPNSFITHSVEVLNGEKWELIESLNVGRSHAHAINYLGKTYVFGGVNSGIMESIEVYKNGWVLQEVKLPGFIRNFGLCGYAGSIFLFGGESNTGEKTGKVHEFSLQTNSFIRSNSMDFKFISNNFGTVYCVEGTFFMLDYESRSVLTYLK